jgi:hypothetical protein
MSKYIRQFGSFQDSLRTKEKTILAKIQESVLAVNDEFRVKSIIELQPSLINAYISKVKKMLGKDLTQSYSKDDIAEELVKFVVNQGLKVDLIPEWALLGGGPESAETTTTGTDEMPAAPAAESPSTTAPAAAPATDETTSASPEVPAVEPNSEVKTTTESLPEGEEKEETSTEGEEEEKKEDDEEEPTSESGELPA